MPLHKILTPLCAALVFSVPVFSAVAQTAAGDNVLLQMQEAARKGDKARLAALLPPTAGAAPSSPLVALGAARLGSTRLIDNLEF